MDLQAVIEPPICGICGKKYDPEASMVDVKNHWYGTNIQIRIKDTLFRILLGLRKRRVARMELCHDCFEAVEHCRRKRAGEIYG